MLAASALFATFKLAAEPINSCPTTNSSSALLLAGAMVWTCQVLSFSLPYSRPDFAFPQQLQPGIAPPHWRPVYRDYLYVGFTAATAFSPTDAMPLTAWPKFAMMVVSTISLIALSRVAARAVNVFT